MMYCEPVCQITQIFLAVQERRSGSFRLNLTAGSNQPLHALLLIYTSLLSLFFSTSVMECFIA